MIYNEIAISSVKTNKKTKLEIRKIYSTTFS